MSSAPDPVSPDAVREHRIAPGIAARLLGLTLAAVGVLVLLATVLAAALDLHTALLLVPVVLGLALIVATSVLLTRRGTVLRLTPEGYRVRWVRGAGVQAARWSEVAEALATSVSGAPCVVLRLHDGRTTTIPVQVLATDPDVLVAEVRARLRGRRPGAPGGEAARPAP